MRLIKLSNVVNDSEKYPEEIQKEVRAWIQTVKEAEWRHLQDIRNTYNRSVDQVGNRLIFNIKSYRLIVGFNFQTKTGIIYYKHLLTHQEYELNKWKNDSDFQE
ncbi:MAG: type II toxin-antitoxin system HigB family toxin [Symploca sp. SIO1B1]|nr:type II toxin-antitoxin system HigB family toxin [Symploca sp. SIO1A3]NER97755.1 type II toxin-antitoxin system HigB family toxin [Symploca sp. SIO1B1]